MFKHNICRGQPEVRDGMLDFANPLPPKFFASPRCPLVRVSSEVATTEVRRGKEVDRGVPLLGIQMEHLLFFLPRSPFFFFFFIMGPVWLLGCMRFCLITYPY